MDQPRLRFDTHYQPLLNALLCGRVGACATAGVPKHRRPWSEWATNEAVGYAKQGSWSPAGRSLVGIAVDISCVAEQAPHLRRGSHEAAYLEMKQMSSAAMPPG